MSLLAQTTPGADIVTPFLPKLADLGGYGLVVVLLAFCLLAFPKGWVVTKRQYEEMKADRDDWRTRGDKEHDLRVKAEETASTALQAGNVTLSLLSKMEPVLMKLEERLPDERSRRN